MAKAFRARQQGGTARQAHAPGYAGNGVSEFSRDHANGPGNIRLTNTGLLAKHRKELRKLEIKLSIATAPDEIAKLKHNIGIKTDFLARIEAEQEARQ